MQSESSCSKRKETVSFATPSSKKLKTNHLDWLFNLNHDELLKLLQSVLTDEDLQHCSKSLCGKRLLTCISAYNVKDGTKVAIEAIVKCLTIDTNLVGSKHVAYCIAYWLIDKIEEEDSKPITIEQLIDQYSKDPLQVYDEAFKLYCSNISNPTTIHTSIQEEIDLIINNKDNNFVLSTIQTVMVDEFVLPLPYIGGAFKGSKVLAKHHLPFMKQFHIDTNNDKLLEEVKHNTIALISTSGIGKTALMIRKLCKYPGILLTGTAQHEIASPQTEDCGVRELMSLFNSRLEAFAFVRQSILILLISKLVHILEIIKIFKNGNYEKDELFSLIAFNQSNGNTEIEQKIFRQLFKKLKFRSIKDLRIHVTEMIEQVKKETNSNQFMICVDEANVLEEHSKNRYISVNGNNIGMLNVMAYEITLVNSKGRNMYAGTSFSVDISRVVKSIIGKSEMACLNLYEFEYLNINNFYIYLNKHIKIDNNILKLNTIDMFRIRHASLLIEFYVNSVLQKYKPSFLKCFLDCTDKMINDLTRTVTNFFRTQKEMPLADFVDIYVESLYEYILHYEYRDMLGSSFYITNNSLACHLLGSGLTCPVNSTAQTKIIEFRAVDYLGYQFAHKLCQIIQHNKMDKKDLAIYCIENTESCMLEYGILIALCLLNGSKLSSLINLENNITINSNLKECLLKINLNCQYILTSNGYYEYCKEREWIDLNIESGDHLYFYNAINHPERVLDIIFIPPNIAHDDAILALKREPTCLQDDRQLVFLRFSFKDLLTTGGNDKYNDELVAGYKSTRPELMYANNYQSVSLETLDNYYKSLNSSTTNITTIKEETDLINNMERNSWLCTSMYSNYIQLFAHNSLSIVFHPNLDQTVVRSNILYHDVQFLNLDDVSTLLGNDISQIIDAKETDVEKVSKTKPTCQCKPSSTGTICIRCECFKAGQKCSNMCGCKCDCNNSQENSFC